MRLRSASRGPGKEVGKCPARAGARREPVVFVRRGALRPCGRCTAQCSAGRAAVVHHIREPLQDPAVFAFVKEQTGAAAVRDDVAVGAPSTPPRRAAQGTHRAPASRAFDTNMPRTRLSARRALLPRGRTSRSARIAHPSCVPGVRERGAARPQRLTVPQMVERADPLMSASGIDRSVTP